MPEYPTIYDQDIPHHYADVMTVADWLAAVKAGNFIDYDGCGHAVLDGKMASPSIYPSEAYLVPEEATHIAWFNR